MHCVLRLHVDDAKKFTRFEAGIKIIVYQIFKFLRKNVFRSLNDIGNVK